MVLLKQNNLMIYLIAGLGNPGSQYFDTRHNIGFSILEVLSDKLSLVFKYDSKFLSDMALYRNNNSKFYFIKPQTFMNLSGEAIYKIRQYYKDSKLFVLHDELDLPFGVIKFKNGGGNGGHNGLKSIDNLCGNDYYRLRFGIGKSDNVIQHVLGKFENQDEKKRLVEHCVEALMYFLDNPDFLKLQNDFTLK